LRINENAILANKIAVLAYSNHENSLWACICGNCSIENQCCGKTKSISNPKLTAAITIDNTYNSVIRLPTVCNKTVIDAILVAGPAIKNTNAAPGEIPLSNRAAATGIDPVAQV